MWYFKYINFQSVRYSTIYVDAFGREYMTTCGKAVYNGSKRAIEWEVEPNKSEYERVHARSMSCTIVHMPPAIKEKFKSLVNGD